MIPRPDLIPEDASSDLEIFQITDEDVPASHVYMEAQIFTPDSKCFILHRSAHAHGSNPDDPEHRYMVCNLEGGGALAPITEELAAKAPSVSPDGESVYYFVDQTRVGHGRLSLKRVNVDGTGRETILAVEGPISDTPYQFSHGYPISTISSDGRRIVYSGFLGAGAADTATWGFLVFDVEKATVDAYPSGEDWHNLHPQYSRSLDPERSHDVLIQQNHGSVTAPDGTVDKRGHPLGADIHVIRDDGTGFRDMPWGRDVNERCQGHQCWIGRSDVAITSTLAKEPVAYQIIAGREAPESGHLGKHIPDAWRSDMTRDFERPRFFHFATDMDGRRFITDYRTEDMIGVMVAEFPAEESGALQGLRLVANTKGERESQVHTHPFLSPDGRLGFFNSNESGILQAYMVRGF